MRKKNIKDYSFKISNKAQLAEAIELLKSKNHKLHDVRYNVSGATFPYLKYSHGWYTSAFKGGNCIPYSEWKSILLGDIFSDNYEIC
jgi:hypothetical protein